MTRMRTAIGVSVALMLGLASATEAQPVLWPDNDGGNDHYYEAVYVDGGCTWAEADAMAQSMELFGIQGNLVTLTSQAEHDFVWNELGTVNFYWAGGFQDPGSVEPDGGWQWVTDEPWDFTHWAPDEPNNSTANADGHEDRLQIGRHQGAEGWNDLWPNAVVSGFIVEFDTSLVPTESRTVSQIKSKY